MTFGRIIKQLRHRADMTQEELAESLSISAQAVSRWECDLAMPDISLLPVLANLFDVTTDYLLGVDISKKSERIKEIIGKAESRGILGYKKEAADIIRAGLREYPRNNELMYWLQLHLSFYAMQCEGEERTQILREVVQLGEKLVATCTDEYYRYDAIERLCLAYSQLGQTQRALKLAEALPNVWITRDAMLARITHGNARYEAKKNALASLLDAACVGFATLNTQLDDGSPALSQDELIKTHKNVLVIADMLCPDGDYGSIGLSVMQSCSVLARLYLDKAELEAGLSFLERSAEFAVRLDTEYDPQKKHTSPLLSGRAFGKISFGDSANLSHGLLDELNREGYIELILNSERGREIVAALEASAGTR